MADELMEADGEEGGGTAEERDWKGLACAIAVISFISAIIGTIIVLFTPVGSINYDETTFDANALRNAEQHFIEQSWWISDNEIVYHVPRKGANIYNSRTHNLKRVADSLFTSNSLNESILAYSKDVRYTAQIVVRGEAFRNPDKVSFSVIIHDNSNALKYPVGLGAREEEDFLLLFPSIYSHFSLQILAFKWSHSSAFAFVHNDDVYYVSSPPQQPLKVTSNQEERGLIHGRFDWVYNEEIYSRNKIQEGALWFSPSDKYLAYASRPDKSSREVIMTTFSKESNYDYHYSMEYPKTGVKRIPLYTLSIWSVHTRRSISMDVQLRDSSAFHYLFAVSWVVLHGKELLLSTWANRWQNETSITLCDYGKGTCSLIYEHKYEDSQWASPEDYANMIHSDDSIFFLLPKTKRGNSWQNIAKIDINGHLNLNSISFVLSGEYDIRKIVAYRPYEDVIIYEAQAPLPWNRHIYAASVGERSILKGDKCVTCVPNLSNCTYQGKSSVSPGKELNIDFSCNGPSQFYQAMISLNLTLDPIELQIITEPSTIFTKIPQFKTETFLLSNGYEANVRIYEGDHRLHSVPVTLIVYGGPDQNQVSDKFEAYPRPIGYKHAIVYIDVRGSGGRGWKYRSPIYGKLISVEVEDTLEAIKMVLAKYPRLDRHRIGVYGWSYGGTLAARLVELAPEGFFKCVLAVAPVANFIYYDAPYTERFMGDSPRSSFTDITKDVSKFMHTNLLLVHGLRDDNVHFQNSALLIEQLQRANIPFQLMVYPNQGHSLNQNINDHLGQLFQDFLSTCYA